MWHACVGKAVYYIAIPIVISELDVLVPVFIHKSAHDAGEGDCVWLLLCAG